MRLTQLLVDFLEESRGRGLALSTLATYRSRLGAFVAWAGPRAGARALTVERVSSYLVELVAGITSAADHRKSLSSFCNYARRRRVLRGLNPAAAELHRLARPRWRRRRRTMTGAEDLVLRREACRRDVWPAVLLARWAGLRRGEACSARWCDVDVAGGAVELPGLEGGRKHPRTVWLSAWVQLQLRGWMTDTTWPARPADEIWPHHAKTADRRLAEICGDAGLRRLTWNVLRASFVTDCFRGGMTAKEESLIVGHSPAVAERYYNEWLAREARVKLPPDPMERGDGAAVSVDR